MKTQNFPYQRLSYSRLAYYSGMVFKIESAAFGVDYPMFHKCRDLLHAIWKRMEEVA